VERIFIEAEGASYLDRLKTRARARFADSVLCAHARRVGRISERERERRAEQQAQRERRTLAWRMFVETYLSMARAKGGQETFFTPAQRTEIVFAHFAPIALPEPAPAGATFLTGPSGEEAAELKAFVEERRSVEKLESDPPGISVVRPGCFPQPVPVDSADDDMPSIGPPAPAGHWEWRPVAGHFPMRRRRIWIPAELGEDE
jgi:hypothetical protein